MLQAEIEPFWKPRWNHSILSGGAAVGESLGIDCAAGHFLDAVVSDGGCGFQAGVSTSPGSSRLRFLRRVSPDAREAVGLQLQSD